MRTDADGGQDDALAPVIPLFGGEPSVVERASTRAGDDGERTLTPATRVEGEDRSSHEPARPWHTTWTGEIAGAEPVTPDEAQARDAAEAALLKKLRARSLSVREARGVLLQEGLDEDGAAVVVDSLLGHGYLDDVRLAEQLVYSGADRRGQGRRAIAQTLAKRGIPREIADAALADAVDDDAERALEYARHKAPGMRGLDRDTALRRLAGQLARRGYGSAALDAARRALDELAPTRPPVRFEP